MYCKVFSISLEERVYFKVFSISLEGQKQLLSSSHPHAYVTMHIEARSASANKKVRFCIKCVFLVTGMGQCLNDCSRMLWKSLQSPQSSVMHKYIWLSVRMETIILINSLDYNCTIL